ncbi:hypothetical protein KR044_003984 [Drosophila immigrans]|nr:hypothetical protein KR044_003984 [Drosophila immigrans]
MNPLRSLRTLLRQLFHHHYPAICIGCCIASLLTAYLQYEWKAHSFDLMSWKRLGESCYAAACDIDPFQLCVLLAILLINVVFVGLIVAAYAHPLGLGQRDSDELTLLEIKDRFARFILLRLIARLDRIQGKMSAKRKALSLPQLARAHRSLVKAVAVFRKDARKLLLPNEAELLQPIEDVYGVAEDEERALRRDNYFKLPIDATDATVKRLFCAR